MAELKTKATDARVADFITAVENPQRRADAETVCAMLAEITGEPPVLWGTSIVGFGRYRYKYDSGHEGESSRIGFSPRKANLTIYIVPGFAEQSDLLARLGKVKTSVSCLYVNKLADVDMTALRQLCEWSVGAMAERYPE